MADGKLYCSDPSGLKLLVLIFIVILTMPIFGMGLLLLGSCIQDYRNFKANRELRNLGAIMLKEE